jgi:serine protease Do
LTTGKVSASWEDYRNKKGWDVFQTETSLNPGNSGGPLLDGSGAVIGVNTFIIRKGEQGLTLTGLNFAVKSTTARTWIKGIIGELPPASLANDATYTLPSAGEVDQAKAPDKPQETARTFIRKSGKGQKRAVTLAKPEQREATYSHTEQGKPGTLILGAKLDTLEKIKAVHDIFDTNSFNQ